MFYVEQISNGPSPQRNNSPNVLNSTELSEHHTAGMLASPKHHIFTVNDDSNDPTIPYGFGRQLPIVPPSLNDMNLPPNPINILATMTVSNNTEDANIDNYSPQSLELHELSSISTPPMNVSTLNSWDTSYTSTRGNTFHSKDEARRIYFLPTSPSSPPSPPRKLKREPGNVLSKRKRSVAAPLRSLRKDDPLSKGHLRSIKQELEL